MGATYVQITLHTFFPEGKKNKIRALGKATIYDNKNALKDCKYFFRI